MQRDRSPPSSPPRKRQRLSSPTYDEQLDDLSYEALLACDELEDRFFKLSQQSQDTPVPTFTRAFFPDQGAKAFNLPNDSENPFDILSTVADAAAAAQPLTQAALGFSTASALRESAYNPFHHEHSSSPEASQGQDFSAWFALTSHIPPAESRSASASLNLHAPLGFTKASNKGQIIPSAMAFAKAQAKIQNIWREVDSENLPAASISVASSAQPEQGLKEAHIQTRVPTSPLRVAFRAVENSPVTPCPTGFSRPRTRVQSDSLNSPSMENFIRKHSKPFKSPLVTKNSATLTLSINRQSSTKPSPFKASSLNDQSDSMLSHGSLVAPNRPQKAEQEKGPKPFITPFKHGIRPGQVSVQRFEEINRGFQSKSTVGEARNYQQVGDNFSLSEGTSQHAMPDIGRKSLESSGLIPQRCTSEDLASMGIYAAEVNQINNLATYYTFNFFAPAPNLTTPSPGLGPADALIELLNKGCSLATKPWVDNHWCLILWKLAGMVALDPHTEDTSRKRWSWEEVMRQLLYRYKRELAGGKRPTLRLLTTQDAPASYPMILCVSDIIWPPPEISEDGAPIELHPELEVTDGWYRLRAQIDAPLARALKRGAIRIGRKIGLAGAKLFSERKEPSEVLEAYNSTKLIIFGNSSHLAPWHAKLGFSADPYISTLHSLTHDGGPVAVMDLVVVKAYPIAFLEFYEDHEGKKRSKGPWNQSEEARVQEQWRNRREVQMSKLQEELEKKWSRYEGYIDQLERRAGSSFKPEDNDSPPDEIENLYDRLEDPAEATRVLKGLSSSAAGWLARHIKECIVKDRENFWEDLESEVKHVCPPREVRSFRILLVQDACTRRRPANRTAQLTVWDIVDLSFSEGAAPGTIEVGQRFMVTNLVPTQFSAWMDCAPGSEVFLATRRDSRWKPVKC